MFFKCIFSKKIIHQRIPETIHGDLKAHKRSTIGNRSLVTPNEVQTDAMTQQEYQHTILQKDITDRNRMTLYRNEPQSHQQPGVVTHTGPNVPGRSIYSTSNMTCVIIFRETLIQTLKLLI